ncbi:hypothetical protein ACIBG8_13435 [Nonomuraea sp. NPDC050556]|uniref:hypothetical protein n=1 Tax=Nonomuraea sp. NPDC050556 TaxID=3364369 RepID=UPI0037BCA154
MLASCVVVVAGAGGVAARADTTGLVSVTSVDDLMCGEPCRPVIGGLIAYSDRSHLTTTFARTLAPEITAAVRACAGSVGARIRHLGLRPGLGSSAPWAPPAGPGPIPWE